MLLQRAAVQSLLKAKRTTIVPVANCITGGFHNERQAIGKREWVGYGVNSMPNYFDIKEIPMPGVRFKEITGDLVALREKEKGDWKKLTLEEKKQLYRASFCQTFAEVDAPTGQWKSTLGWTLFCSSIAVFLFTALKLFVLPPLPESFKEENRAKAFRMYLVNRDGFLDGLSSKWDYEKDDWK